MKGDKRQGSRKNKAQGDEIKNFYELLPKRLLPEYHNPSFKQHLMKIPFRALIIGGSGSGKTNLILEMIRRMAKTFQLILLCVKNRDEPLYNYLAEQLSEKELIIVEGMEEVPEVECFSEGKPKQILAIFDDLVLEKDQSKIEQYFIRARKISGGISCCYLTQSYFKTPKLIRINCNYLFLKKLSSERDLNLILSEFSLGVDKKQLLDMYRYSTTDPLSFLMVDIDVPPEKRFRRGFLDIL